MVVVILMVMEDGKPWQSCRMHVLVWEVMLHHGEPDGVVDKVVVMELVVVVGPTRRECRGMRPGSSGIGNTPGAAYPGQPATGPIGGRPRCTSSSCPRSSCRRQSSRLSKCTLNGTTPAANCA